MNGSLFSIFLLLSLAQTAETPIEEEAPPAKAPARPGTPAIISIDRQMHRFRPGAPRPTPPAEQPESRPPATPHHPRGPLSRPSPTRDTNDGEPTGGVPQEALNVIPPFRLLAVELVLTLDSTHLRTPVIGLITEDFWWKGKLILPAGTEVHGMAAPDRLRDRIVAETEWTLIFPRAPAVEEVTSLRIRALALDREQLDPEGLRFAPEDGSFGLRGELRYHAPIEEERLFLAAFLEGLSRAAQRREASGSLLGGTEVSVNARNAVLAGTAEVLSEYIQRLKAEIPPGGSFIRVPAGKQFFLYTIEPWTPPL